jgi:uncharacterized protein (DUF433 family)
MYPERGRIEKGGERMPDNDEQVQGPNILGTRLTVYHLLDAFLDPSVTECDICRVYNLTAQQVAAARAYVLRNPETVLAQHLKIEERLAAENPPQVRDAAERAMATFKSFKEWLAEREAANREEDKKERPGRLPTFKEWLAEQELVSG